MITGKVMVGSCVVGVIVCTPVPILKWIVSPLPLAFASRIACRSDPGPESLILVTLKFSANAVLRELTVNSRIDTAFIS